jgi:hypothetical protein
MLRGVIICPDQELSADLQDALAETHHVGIVRSRTATPPKLSWSGFFVQRRRK